MNDKIEAFSPNALTDVPLQVVDGKTKLAREQRIGRERNPPTKEMAEETTSSRRGVAELLATSFENSREIAAWADQMAHPPR